MGRGGDTTVDLAAVLAAPEAPDPRGAPWARALSPVPGGSSDRSAASGPDLDVRVQPRASRLAGWRDALAAAGSKRKASEEAEGREVSPAVPAGTPSAALVRRKPVVQVSASVRVGAALLDACRLDTAPGGVRGWDSEDEAAAEAEEAAAAAAEATGGGTLGAAPPPPLPLVHAASADGQPLDDSLWGVPPPAKWEAQAAVPYMDNHGEEIGLVSLDGSAAAGDETPEADPPHGSLTVALLKHQRRALAWMTARESGSGPVGGMLADDQGLGKTLTSISLIVSRRPPPRPAALRGLRGAALGAGTLVVCPTSVLRQWARELRTRVSGAAALSVLLYHGPSRSRSPHEVARYDVVLTTYAIVTQELQGTPASPGVPATCGVLGQLVWWRCVLDEAQSIKNARSQVAAAVWALRCRRRWCLSGTPLQNSVDDLFSYFRFLRYSPYDTMPSFRALVREPIRLAPEAGFAALQRMLRVVMLRRTKATLIGGQPIVKLPPRSVSMRSVEFNGKERTEYGRLQSTYRARVAEMRAAGTVATNYVNILFMLLRLRQACNHLALSDLSAPATARVPASEVAAARRLPERRRAALLSAAEGAAECSFCDDLPDDPTVAPCGAVFCKPCWAQRMAAEPRGDSKGAKGLRADDAREPCPSCGMPHRAGDAHTVAALKAAAPGAAGPKAPAEIPHDPAASCKLRSVLAYLRDLRVRTGCVDIRPSAAVRPPPAKKGRAGVARDKGEQLRAGLKSSDAALAAALPPLPPVVHAPRGAAVASAASPTPEKVIIFSQWTGMLNLLEPALAAEGFAYRRLDGTMSLASRERELHEFESRPEVTVMLMSLKAAGLGVNLVCANHVLLLDVWWNPTVEEQAIDRSHRIGQTREVHVARFTVRGTVEDRILALQEHKRALAAAAFGEAGAGEGGADGAAAAQAKAAQAGAAERSKLTVEDLLFLFEGDGGVPGSEAMTHVTTLPVPPAF